MFRCPQEKKRTLPFPSCLPPAVSCSPRLSIVFRVENWQTTDAMIGVGAANVAIIRPMLAVGMKTIEQGIVRENMTREDYQNGQVR